MKKVVLFILLGMSLNSFSQTLEQEFYDRFFNPTENSLEYSALKNLRKLESIKDSVPARLLDVYMFEVGVALFDIYEHEKSYEILKRVNYTNLTQYHQNFYWGYLTGATEHIDSTLAIETYNKYFEYIELNKSKFAKCDSAEIVQTMKAYYAFTYQFDKAYEYSLLEEQYNDCWANIEDDIIYDHHIRIFYKYKHISQNKDNKFTKTKSDLKVLDSLFNKADQIQTKLDILNTSMFVANLLNEYDLLIYYSIKKDTVNQLLCEEKQRANTRSILQETKLKHSEQEIKHLNALNQQKRRINIIIGVSLIIVVIILLIVFVLLKHTKAQKVLIEQSKKVIENKNKEMIDSIEYAKNIQSTIMVDISEIENDNCFVLYKPKDIVSGDFYWYAKTEQYTYYAAADCTGHGVPGALVSMLCSQALNDTIKQFVNPNDILTYTNQVIYSHMSKFNRQDGMDVALAAIDFENNKVLFSGANRPLFVYSNKEVQEINGTKQSIGGYNTKNQFELVELTLSKGDTVYLTTDGFIDQFGGENNKKFGKKNFKELLLKINQTNFEKHKTIIDAEFTSWKGEHNEQTDDVCVIGISL
jgi:serine phosphatase RsbU (regulator of sigma subunit)